MNMTLYEIAPEFADLVERDELTAEDSARLDELAMALEKKADNIAALNDKMGQFVAMCKAEEVRISAKRKAVENRIDWLKNYLQTAMEAAGIYEIEVGTRKIALQKNPPAVVIDDEEKIPAEFYTVKTTTTLDKVRVKDELKKGAVPGVHLEQSLSVRFK